MDRQAVFNIVFTGLRSQSFQRSVNLETGTCKYRGPKDRKCAIGHLIPDDLYDDRFDRLNIPAERLITNHKNLQAHLGTTAEKNDLMFFGALQAIHDRPRSPEVETMEDSLRSFAHSNNLTVPE